MADRPTSARFVSWVALALLSAVRVASPQSTSGVTGDLRLVPFESRIFGNSRLLRILLPPGYDAPENRERRYPVLYLNDGQNLFDSTTATLNPAEWHIDETIAHLIHDRQIEPLIVVGIDNAGRRGRFKEYFPYVDRYLSPPEPEPRGLDYPAFLVDEVVPFVDARYRTLREARARGIGGSSAGALAAIYAVMSRPGVFERLLVESPSLYLDDYHVLRDASKVRQWPDRIYFGVGTNESNRATCAPQPSVTGLAADVIAFADSLRRGGVDSTRIRVHVVQCAQHNEQAWAERFPTAVTFLFGGRGRPPAAAPAHRGRCCVRRTDVARDGRGSGNRSARGVG